MPIPFDDRSGPAEHREVIGWLRVLPAPDGAGVLAALLETSVDGEPLGFCFTRSVDRHQPSHVGAAPSALVALLRVASTSPALLLGRADEVPADLVDSAVRVRVPFCLLGPTDQWGASGGPISDRAKTWLGVPPATGTEADRLLEAILASADPLEPFEQTAEGLREAFNDPHVNALAASPGLATVVSLLPAAEGRRPLAQAALGTRQAPAHDRQRDDREAARFDPLTGSPSALAERLWHILRPPAASISRPEQLDWVSELMPFQRDGVQALLENPRLLLADDMGLGKTVQAIAAIRILYASRRIGSCLVAAPASVLDQWRREVARWAPELSAIIVRGSAADREWQWAARRDITLVGYESLRADFDSRLSHRVWDLVVTDEAQRIKNRNDTSDVLKALRRHRSWALTGTPIENDEEELASILEFVDHREEGERRSYRPGPELRERHRELQLRRKKGDVLEDLPPKLVTMVPIELNPEQRRSYDKAERDGVVYLKSLGTEVGVQHVLELITRLKQICNADPRTGESAKLADIRERMDQLAAQGHKALIFSQYTSDSFGVELAAKAMQGHNPLVITGEVPLEDRAGIIDRFKTRPEHRALILSLRVGGLGLNLQNASYVFHLDRWWNPATERQAEDRTHRMGQTVKVNVVKYSCIGTIEARIDRILESKKELFARLVDDVSLDLSTRLSSEELFGLFDL
ncbi:MAG: DEAD/DEAH box helicase [bacterium]|nr:DEAD/DEAH box helicase [bacterium]